MKETYLALDLGTTKLLIGEVDISGKILNYKRYETGYIDQVIASSVIKRSLEDYITTEGWVDGQRPVSMGVGLMGRVDNEKGMWQQMGSKKNPSIPLAAELSDLYDMPCYIDNDVKGTTLAVKKWGYGKYSDNFIYINIGSSISAGFFHNGHIIKGSSFNAGEIEHMTTCVDVGIKCSCGRFNCIRQIAGGTGFDKSARFLKKQYPTELYISQDKNIKVDVKEICFLYQQGDKLCVQLVENATKAIAGIIMDLVRASYPDTVVLGGGIVSNELIFPKILDKLNRTSMKSVSHGIQLTQLEPNFAGLLGAATIAMKGHQIHSTIHDDISRI